MKTNYFIASAFLAVSTLTAFSLFNKHDQREFTESAPTCKQAPVCKKPVATNQTKFSFDAYVESRKKEFFYDLGTRFNNHVSMIDLQNAKTIWDILPSDVAKQVRTYTHTQIHIVKENGDIIAKGNSESLNQDQLALIKKMNYSTNLRVFADFSPIETPQSDDYISYYMTIVPAQEALYPGGKDALLNHIKKESAEEVNEIDPTTLGPGKIYFMVSKKGEITQFGLESSCGNKTVDMKMISIINNLPKKFIPAKNEDGIRIEQKLYLSFGIIGC